MRLARPPQDPAHVGRCHCHAVSRAAQVLRIPAEVWRPAHEATRVDARRTRNSTSPGGPADTQCHATRRCVFVVVYDSGVVAHVVALPPQPATTRGRHGTCESCSRLLGATRQGLILAGATTLRRRGQLLGRCPTTTPCWRRDDPCRALALATECPHARTTTCCRLKTRSSLWALVFSRNRRDRNSKHLPSCRLLQVPSSSKHQAASPHWGSTTRLPTQPLANSLPLSGGSSDDSVHGGDMNGCRSHVLWQRHATTPPGPSFRRATRGWWRLPRTTPYQVRTQSPEHGGNGQVQLRTLGRRSGYSATPWSRSSRPSCPCRLSLLLCRWWWTS